MPVTRPLLSCSPFLSFQSTSRASGQSCAQCPWFLHNLHFVQPEKSCSPLAHSPTFVRSRGCFNLYNSQLHLSPPLRFRGAARACSFSVSRCGCLGQRKQSRSGRISMHPAGYWVDGCFGGADLTVFHVGNTNILWVSRFWWCRHIQIDFHTFHFSFPANFLHLLFFLSC